MADTAQSNAQAAQSGSWSAFLKVSRRNVALPLPPALPCPAQVAVGTRPWSAKHSVLTSVAPRCP
jgi:hypothetical protein